MFFVERYSTIIARLGILYKGECLKYMDTPRDQHKICNNGRSSFLGWSCIRRYRCASDVISLCIGDWVAILTYMFIENIKAIVLDLKYDPLIRISGISLIRSSEMTIQEVSPIYNVTMYFVVHTYAGAF